MRDYQRQRVYDWEQHFVAKFDNGTVSFENAQNIVNYIWEKESLSYPPVIKELPPQNKIYAATGSRTAIQIPKVTQTWIILHELAHSMTSDVDGSSHWHNPTFVGIYANLLVKYLNIDLSYILYTLKMSKVDFDLFARPSILL